MTTEVKPDNSSAFKTLFDIATDGIFIEDETGTILECNPAGEKMFGYLPGELKNAHISKLVPPDFAATLHIQALEDIAQNKNISITKAFPENLTIRTDKNMLLFIVRNLIINAIKFTKPGGEIAITVHMSQNNARITIEDSGVGLTSEQIEKIKDQHTIYSTHGTRSEKGTGLGLKVCNDFLKILETRLEIKSTPGKGSAFSFDIPVVVS